MLATDDTELLVDLISFVIDALLGLLLLILKNALEFVGRNYLVD